MKDIPDNIDWVIRVDGHTDDIPLSGFGHVITGSLEPG